MDHFYNSLVVVKEFKNIRKILINILPEIIDLIPYSDLYEGKGDRGRYLIIKPGQKHEYKGKNFNEIITEKGIPKDDFRKCLVC